MKNTYYFYGLLRNCPLFSGVPNQVIYITVSTFLFKGLIIIYTSFVDWPLHFHRNAHVIFISKKTAYVKYNFLFNHKNLSNEETHTFKKSLHHFVPGTPDYSVVMTISER